MGRSSVMVLKVSAQTFWIVKHILCRLSSILLRLLELLTSLNPNTRVKIQNNDLKELFSASNLLVKVAATIDIILAKEKSIINGRKLRGLQPDIGK
jgi:hypothetical protein